MAKIISLASQKGGVGKSVSAVNLAYAFAIGGYKILLIDFDSQGSVRTSLGIQDLKISLICSHIFRILNAQTGSYRALRIKIY